MIGIADANPVGFATVADEGLDEGFLQWYAVLGFVFEDVRPSLAQAVSEMGALFEQIGGVPDEVVEVAYTLLVENVLITAVNPCCHP